MKFVFAIILNYRVECSIEMHITNVQQVSSNEKCFWR